MVPVPASWPPWPLSARQAEVVWSSLARVAVSEQLPVQSFYQAGLLEPPDPDMMPALSRLITRAVRGAVARRLVPTDIDDLVQEVAMRLFSAVARGNFPSRDAPPPSAMSLRHYVSAICSHALTDSLRRAYRQPRTESLDLERHDMIDPQTELEANLLQGERRTLVREALATLSPTDQNLVQMHYFEGRTLAEVAGSLNMAVATVHGGGKSCLRGYEKWF